MSARAYLDWNATAPIHPAAVAAAQAALAICGNPSSVHGEGRAARALVEDARRSVAGLMGARADDVVFTGGGTDALHLAARSAVAEAGDAPAILIGATEHEASRAAAEAAAAFARAPLIETPVHGDGRLDLTALDAAIRSADGRTPVLILQAVNNETGVLQPIGEAASRLGAAGGLTILDAVQAVGRTPFDLAETGADFVVASAHKMGGLQGVGAAAKRADRAWRAVISGGGQERFARGGTENVSGIAAFGAAAEAVDFDAWRATCAVRDRLEARLQADDPTVVFFGADADRAPNVTCFASLDMTAELGVLAMDLAGFAISAGSACSSGTMRSSRVIAAMGRADLSDRGVRVSFGPGAVEADADAFADAWSTARARTARKAAA